MQPTTQPTADPQPALLDLIEGLDAIVWEMDARTWRFNYVSRRAEHVLGYPVERWLEDDGFWAEVVVHPEDRGWAVDYCVSCTGRSEDHDFEYRACAADGRVVWLRDVVRVVRDEDGEARLLRGVMFDVTSEREAREALRRRNHGLELLQRIGVAASESVSLDDALAVAVTQVCAFTGWPVGHVVIRGPQAAPRQGPGHLWHMDDGGRFGALRRAGEESQGGSLLLSDPAAAEDTVWVEDVGADPSLADSAIARHGVGAGFAFPVRAGDETVAALEFFTDRPMPEDEVIVGFARQAGVLLGRVAERVRSATLLRQRQEQLELSQRLAHIGSWEWDAGADTVTWSDELYRIYGLEPGSVRITFEEYLSRLHPEDRDRVAALIGQALESGAPFEFDERILRPDGEVRVLRSRGEAVIGPDGRTAGLTGTCHDVTDLDTMVERIEATGRRLQHILDSVVEGIYGLDKEGRTTFLNRAAADMLGYRMEELSGRRQHDVLHHTRANGSPFPWHECPIQDALTHGRVVRIENDLFWRRDGTSFPVSYTATPVRENGELTGAVISFQDLTERKRTEGEAANALFQLVSEQAARAEAETMQSHLHRLFQQVPAVVAITRGPSHVYELANPMFRQTVGNREVVGKTFREVFPELGEQGFYELIDRVYATGEPFVGNEVRVLLDRSADGQLEEGFFNFVYQPLFDAEERVYGIMTHAVEVTEQVRARRFVEEKAEELKRLAAELERSNKELDQFAYVTSHDLKAPLRGIANLSQWLEEDLGDRMTEDAHEHLRLLRVRVHRMEALIDGILQFSRAGRVRVAQEPIDTGLLVRDVIELLAPPTETTFEIDDDMPTVFAELLPLQQVFQNLIGNAIKHAHADAPLVRIGARDSGAFYEFSVSDNGPGIAEEYQDRIWGIFQTLQARDKVEGTGIGLALVKKIVETRGGRASVESEPGAGATFRFTWPRQAEGEAAQ